MTKYIFVTGGVVSSLGKGLAASSIGCLLEARGMKVQTHSPRAVQARKTIIELLLANHPDGGLNAVIRLPA